MWKCCIEYLAVDISLVEVVPFIACHELASGTCRNGTTSAIGNSQINTPATWNKCMTFLSVFTYVTLFLF
ncbi:hypothetical protein ACUH7Y_21215 [Clostridium beijerinckii]|uniref:Uncharacterized protein n=1 Tax=Clostridium beijerinckii TaxID=1520 RepID=A0A7X9XME2_CLOBE|nr:hypothetical protein [Clostridium beijerinckii]NMF03317.1 hypothetical protein [Clostridium beijerinckii]NRY60001.1 hypothetical protein [Clostridium beijerinckii]